jgi:hypothetical protein
MAKDKVPKNPQTPPAAATDASKDGSKTKAQIEFQRYMNRMQSQPSGGAPASAMPSGIPPGGQGMPGWAVPPSVAMLPNSPGSAGFFVPMAPGGIPGVGSLTHQLGSTFRLGVDVINAALAGGVRLLNGIASRTQGYGEQGCGCEACSGGCCDSECCGNDCCGGCESCCRPGVGTCC